MIDCQCDIGNIIYEEIRYKWFDIMWDEMSIFSKEHPNHIFVCANDPKNFIIGFLASWAHPKPGYHACNLGIDISDINLERYFKINVKDYMNTYNKKRYPKQLLDLFIVGVNGKPYQTQEHNLELARRIVENKWQKNQECNKQK